MYNCAFVHLNLHTPCSSLSVVLCPLPIAISQFTIAHIAHCAQTLIGVQLRLKIGPASISSPPRFYALAHATVGGCPNYKRLRVCPHISKVSSYYLFLWNLSDVNIKKVLNKRSSWLLPSGVAPPPKRHFFPISKHTKKGLKQGFWTKKHLCYCGRKKA